MCKYPKCGRPVRARGLCNPHYEQDRTGQELQPLRPYRTRAAKGEGTITKGGYRRFYRGGQCILEHREVMETLLGRPLFDGEEVHHKNGVKHDNRPSNLELWVVSQPPGQRPEDLVPWAREILERYESYL